MTEFQGPIAPVRPSPDAAHFRWAALGIFALAVYGSLIPFRFAFRPSDEALAAYRQITLYDPATLEARGDWVISTGMFMALGYLLMAALCADRPWTIGLWASPMVVVAIIALSAAIEFAQLYFPPRTVSVNDIFVESLGGVAGAVLWLIGGQRITDWLRRLGKVTTIAGLAKRVLPGYFVALLVVQLMPFDFVVSYDELALKYSEGKIRPIPWADGKLSGRDAFVKAGLNLTSFAPLGFLLALARRRGSAYGSRPAFPWLALTAPVLVEFLQLLVYSRSCDSADVVTGMIGVYAGWRLGQSDLIARRAQPVVSGRAALASNALAPVLFLAWLGMVVYLYWRPFDFTTDTTRFVADRKSFPDYGIRRFTLTPFTDYYWGSKYNALDQFVRKALSFVPFGVLAALSLRDLYRRGTMTRLMLMTLVISLILEVGRYFLPSRTPSSTDVLIACAGAWFGFRLTHRVRVVLWAESALYGWLQPSAGRDRDDLGSHSRS